MASEFKYLRGKIVFLNKVYNALIMDLKGRT